jgi:serine/threonine protein phosphatase PrpC
MIKTEHSHLRIEASSHPGMTGKQNEDRYGVTAFKTGDRGKKPAVLAVLCDGIGGHRAGEVAAEMGVTIITETVAGGDERHPIKTLTEAIKQASAAIYAASHADQGRAGMGATCACAWVIGDKLFTANLGDSRIYLLRESHLIQLSTDHTWVQEALDAGIISSEEGDDHPNAHVIRRYLGSKGEPEIDFRMWFFDGEDDEAAESNQGMRLKPNDLILLCSDGLTDLVSDEEIRTVLEEENLAEAPEILIGMANARGGHDNITVVLMKAPSRRAKLSGASWKRRWLVGCLLVLVVASILFAGVLLGLRWWRGRSPAAETQAVTESLPVEATIDMITSTVEMMPTPTPTQTVTASTEFGAPQPTITPWPTDTPGP